MVDRLDCRSVGHLACRLVSLRLVFRRFLVVVYTALFRFILLCIERQTILGAWLDGPHLVIEKNVFIRLAYLKSELFSIRFALAFCV